MWLGSWVAVAVAVAVAGSRSSFSSTPILGTSICCEHGPKKKQNKPVGDLAQTTQFNSSWSLLFRRGVILLCSAVAITHTLALIIQAWAQPPEERRKTVRAWSSHDSGSRCCPRWVPVIPQPISIRHLRKEAHSVGMLDLVTPLKFPVWDTLLGVWPIHIECNIM